MAGLARLDGLLLALALESCRAPGAGRRVRSAELILTLLHGAGHLAETAPGFGDPLDVARACRHLAGLEADDAWNPPHLAYVAAPRRPNRGRTADRSAPTAAVRAGEKVTLWWASANRDPGVFDDPDVFDVRRSPNPHLALGRGPHFCLGAGLARMEMRVVFEALLDRVGDFAITGPVQRVRSHKHTGIRHLPMRLEGRRPGA
ncbi:cytochrome P450 [Actinomadura sp. GTD37]|uniref:cytochrome P450 n=1 Tax=Actinomadura sp. GTD37 TaxID=1778030 RepID=UPI0035C09443